MTMSRLLAASVLVLVATAGCGDDDDDTESVAEFCEHLTQFDGQGPFPSDEELDRIADSAPADIESDVDAAVAVLKEQGEEAIGDPALGVHLDAIGEYRDANCEPA